MAQRIVIDPVTRLEGHARITLQADDHGEVQSAQFHVTQLRGFEKFCQGRPFYEMPNLTARICGICPVSHLVASAKACDAILAVRIPPAAVKLREVLNLAQLIQSHALSFFYLSSPDLVLGMDADPAVRSIFGVARADPELGRGGVRLRQFGQQIIESLGGKRIHPGWVVPGGVSAPLATEQRDRILALIPEATAIARMALRRYKGLVENFRAEIQTFGNFPSYFLGLVNPDDRAEYYDGRLRFTDARGHIVADDISAERYGEFIGEAVESYTYMKFPYYKPLGYPEGIYRVGPLARLNIATSCGTPLADVEWAEFRAMERGAVLSSFHYHQARLIEILYGIERIERLLADPEILSRHVRASAAINNLEGIGVSEAPRGTLIHHYRVDENGLLTWANLIIATGHNNAAMNRGILQVASHFVRANRLTDGMLNRVEAVIRTFDPCLSCSTHAAGQMPLDIQLLAPDGSILDRQRRA